MSSVHFVKQNKTKISWIMFRKCLLATLRNPYGENCHFYFCINFDKVIHLVVKVNVLDRKVLCIWWVTNKVIYHSLNEMDWTYTFWDMAKFIRGGLTFLEEFMTLLESTIQHLIIIKTLSITAMIISKYIKGYYLQKLHFSLELSLLILYIHVQLNVHARWKWSLLHNFHVLLLLFWFNCLETFQAGK